jgi:beta-xylosidase
MIKHQKFIIIVVALVCFISGFISGVYVGKFKDIPFAKRIDEWSIGIYTGKDPFNFVCPDNISNPVLTAKDIIDIPADFVADPFMLYENHTWYMFFEVFNTHTGQGDIGLATSKDGFRWEYQQIVLDEPFHLSYPYVFKWQNEYYMIPESIRAFSVRLYKATDFPKKWVFVKDLLRGSYADPSILYHNCRWWLFVLKGWDRDELALYYSDNITGPWTEHPKSPLIIRDKNISRPGGRMIVFDGKILRYTQDGDPTYGNQVRVFKIDALTTTKYQEHEIDESPILKATGNGWNKDGMHHIDAHQIEENKWIACVDGFRITFVFGLQY